MITFELVTNELTKTGRLLVVDIHDDKIPEPIATESYTYGKDIPEDAAIHETKLLLEEKYRPVVEKQAGKVGNLDEIDKPKV
jgi:hypothetical protein